MTLECVEPQHLFRQTLRDRTYDVAELSMASHIAAVAAGADHYVGLPVFLSRSFRHSNLYIRTDRGIASPADLAGKRIGVVDFQQTAALWLRGILADDYDVARRSVRWITAGLHAPVLEDRMTMSPPAGVSVERSSSTLDAMLRDGTIDAMISPMAPRCFGDGTSSIARLWPDYRDREIAYWKSNRVFPIMHLLVIRRELVNRHPLLATAVYDAFEEARRLAAADLFSRDFPKVILPWLAHFKGEANEALGGDPWTYGLNDNRSTIAKMLRYAAEDGLAPSTLTPDALFPV